MGNLDYKDLYESQSKILKLSGEEILILKAKGKELSFLCDLWLKKNQELKEENIRLRDQNSWNTMGDGCYKVITKDGIKKVTLT